jgi:hypothetical protein
LSILPRDSRKNVASAPLFRLHDEGVRAARLKRFRDLFARDSVGPYAVQKTGTDWNTRYKPVSDPPIAAHLDFRYWIAVRAQWYPPFYFLDVDRPTAHTLERILTKLDVRQNEYALMTSPSYSYTGNVHVALKLSYRDRRPTARFGRDALQRQLGNLCEVYPQLNRKFRCPFGKDQYLLNETRETLSDLEWWEAVDRLEQLEEIPVERWPYDPELPMIAPTYGRDDPDRWATHSDAAELWRTGLQAGGTRHNTLFTLAVWLYRNNYVPPEAEHRLRWWIRHRHNGHSRTVNEGRWRVIDDEIGRIVAWIWANFRPYPDGANNLDGELTLADLRFAAELFPRDVVNQKRLIALVAYYRPRRRNEWVWMPWHVWRETAHATNVDRFRATLEEKGVLESIHSYRHVPYNPKLSYPKKFKVRLPQTDETPIERDGRHETDFYRAVLAATGSVRGACELTGVTKQRFSDAKRRDYTLENRFSQANSNEISLVRF